MENCDLEGYSSFYVFLVCWERDLTAACLCPYFEDGMGKEVLSSPAHLLCWKASLSTALLSLLAHLDPPPIKLMQGFLYAQLLAQNLPIFSKENRSVFYPCVYSREVLVTIQPQFSFKKWKKQNLLWS